jgi:prophage antirepressor-like protein
MNDLQIFENPEFGQVRTVERDGQPWLVGKDVAEALGYKNTKDALERHVDDEDKRQNDGVVIHDSIGREQHPVIINESGLYSLVLSSKLPKAKAFKRWVTSEVLPALRKNGVYETVKAQQHIEQLEAVNARLNTAIQAVSTAKAELAEVTAMRDNFIKDRDDFKEHFQKWKSLYGGACDRLRRAESLVQQAQDNLNSRIDQLKIVAFGLPAFDQIMADIFTTEKKE